MKRIKSFLTVVMAAIFALSLVPTGAWAAADWGDGDDGTTREPDAMGYVEGLPNNKGIITIAKTKANETYDVYRIFDLASFNDADTSAGKHDDSTHRTSNTYDGEAYSYVIRRHDAEHPAADDSSDENLNPWWTFLTTTKPTGNGITDDDRYAVEGDGTATLKNHQYFWIEPEPITLKDAYGVTHTDYHVVRATEKFTNAWDVSTSNSGLDTTGHGTFNYDGTDYVDPNNGATNPNPDKTMIQVVQDFAQAALKYAQNTDGIKPNYIESGKTNANGSTVDDTVTVNGTGTVTLDESNNALVSAWDFVNNSADSRFLASKKGQVPLGWYLVGTTMGTLVALDTTNRQVTMYDKNEVPTIEKKVLKKNSTIPADDAITADFLIGGTTANTGPWQENTDADIGDFVMFRTVITAHQGADGYVLHDSMEKGLQFADGATSTGTVGDRYAGTLPAKYETRVFLVRDADNKWEIARKQGDKVNWELRARADNNLVTYGTDGATATSVAAANSDGCDFEVVFKDDVADTDLVHQVNFVGTDSQTRDVKDGDKIVVLYWAKLTGDAVVYGTETGSEPQNAAKTTVKDNQAPPAALVENDTATQTPQKCTDTDGNNRNTNNTILVYGERSHTDWDKAEVTTYPFEVVKTQVSNGEYDPGTTYNLLNGAKFSLYKAVNASNSTNIATNPIQVTVGGNVFTQDSKALVFTQDAATDGNTHSSYKYVGDQATSGATGGTQLVSDFDEAIRVYGLEEGYYILVEDEAPDGFNKLAHPIVVRVNGDLASDNTTLDYDGNNSYNSGAGSNVAPASQTTKEGKLNVYTVKNDGTSVDGKLADWQAHELADTDGATANNPAKYPGKWDHDSNSGTNKEANGGIHIINQTGQELPSTGGIGTTIFYVAGTVLVVGAAVMLVAKRRMGSEA